MQGRITVRLLIIVCALGVVLGAPAIAGAAEISGTVTASDTGAKLAGIGMELYYRIGDSGAWADTTTDSEGAYSFDFSTGGETARVRLMAADITGVYDGFVSNETTIGADETRTVDIALDRDTLAPQVGLFISTYGYVRYSSAAVSAQKASLPTELIHSSLVTDGTGQLVMQALDVDYANSRYFSYPNGSGIKQVGWSTDGAPWSYRGYLDATWVDWYDERPLMIYQELPLPAEGVHSVSLRATDMNGNTSKTRAQLVIVDKSAPVTTYDRKTATTKRLTLKASDRISGVAATFRRDGKTGPFRYGTSVTVPSKGSKRVQFYSLDKVGHIEKVKTLKVSAPARMSKPRPSNRYISPTQRFTVSGSVWGRRGAKGQLRIYRYQNGAYRYVSKRAFTEGSDGRYNVTLRLDPGTYRFRAFYGGYTSTWANPPVRSVVSDTVRIR